MLKFFIIIYIYKYWINIYRSNSFRNFQITLFIFGLLQENVSILHNEHYSVWSLRLTLYHEKAYLLLLWRMFLLLLMQHYIIIAFPGHRHEINGSNARLCLIRLTKYMKKFPVLGDDAQMMRRLQRLLSNLSYIQELAYATEERRTMKNILALYGLTYVFRLDYNKVRDVKSSADL